MTPAEIEVKAACAKREMEHWQAILAGKSCGTCAHLCAGGCSLADGQMPPADIQKTGCQAWAWDCIPF